MTDDVDSQVFSWQIVGRRFSAVPSAVGDEIISITSEDRGEKRFTGEELPTINGYIRGLSGTNVRILRRRDGLEDESVTLERSAFEK